MNLEKLMRQTLIDYFEGRQGDVDPFPFMIDVYLGIISNDYNDDIIWDDVESYDDELERCIEGIEANKYDGIMVPDVYDELIDWVDGDPTIDFEISTKTRRGYSSDRRIVKDKNGGLEKLLNYCGVSYEKNVNYSDQAEEIRDQAEEDWKEAMEDARDMEQMRRDSYRW